VCKLNQALYGLKHSEACKLLIFLLAQKKGRSIELQVHMYIACSMYYEQQVHSYISNCRAGCTCIETLATVLVPLIVQRVDEDTLVFGSSRGSVEHVVLQVATVVVMMFYASFG
jgi:hypothetical protein